MSGRIGQTERERGGYAPDYVMETGYGPVQPVFTVDELVFCPAEGWRRISSWIGYFPVICPCSKLMHTSYPDPGTRRRMREAFLRRTDGEDE